ncbi:MAG TPA: vanadium-dependent haloperoxidase [Burkholderiaceae bacterium]|nr:vanadium-dependent haloperoxidase [Burkholderiaceae bacterium]
MRTLISRRTFCAGTLLPATAALLLPGCGGGGSDPTQSAAFSVRGHAFATAAPALWADIAMRAAAVLPPPGLPPFITARAYAMAFLAAHDALNAIVPVYATYLGGPKAPGANPDAAVAAAVHDVLVHEFPFATALLDSAYASALAALAGDGSVSKGLEIGRSCAAAMLAARANDGLADVEGPFTEGTQPGEYRFTPPFDFAATVRWGDVMKPFSIASAAAYRVGKPYVVTDDAYTADYNEVKALGAAVGSSRTADQSELGKFWLENTNDSWMKIALQLAASRQMDGWALMRTLALIQVAQTDAYTACIESKYFYHFWRPITAIRLGDSDGNPATVGDPGWGSFDPVCPPIPDYPSGHSASGGAGAVVLAQAFGSDALGFTHQSVSLPGPTRSFASFSQAQDEIALSRICVGYHFRLATQAGVAQGRAVATQVMATQLPALG